MKFSQVFLINLGIAALILVLALLSSKSGFKQGDCIIPAGLEDWEKLETVIYIVEKVGKNKLLLVSEPDASGISNSMSISKNDEKDYELIECSMRLK